MKLNLKRSHPLGIWAKDRISGFEGYLIVRSYIISGHEQYLINPQVNKDNRIIYHQTDAVNIVHAPNDEHPTIEETKVEWPDDFALGAQVKHKYSDFEGTIIGLNEHIVGCGQCTVLPFKAKEKGSMPEEVELNAVNLIVTKKVKPEKQVKISEYGPRATKTVSPRSR